MSVRVGEVYRFIFVMFPYFASLVVGGVGGGGDVYVCARARTCLPALPPAFL